jgi:hypothetical protein
LSLKEENQSLKSELEVAALTTKNLSLKLEKVSKSVVPIITEEVIMNSAVFKAVIEQAKLFAEEAGRYEEVKQKLNERTVQL